MIIYRQTTKQIIIDEKKKIKKRGAGRDTYFELYPLNQTTVINYIFMSLKKKRSPNGRLIIKIFAKICIICHKKMIELCTQIL